MTKIFAPPGTNSGKRISVRIPKEMHQEALSGLFAAGKTSKSYSRWVSSAICRLARQPKYWEMVAEEWVDKGENISRSITLSFEAEKALKEMNSTYRCRSPEEKDVNSKIVRTAITQKIIAQELQTGGTNEIT